MRPDEDGFVPFDGSAAGGDPDLAALTDRLSVAGERARAADRLPDAVFANDLRTRLLASATTERTTAVDDRTFTAERYSAERYSADRFRARPVRPHVTTRTPAFLPAPRWTAIAVAAALVLSLVGLNADRILTPPDPATASDVASATLVRGGLETTLSSGMALQAGDTVRTDADGHATLGLGGAIARLSGSTAVRLVAVGAEVVALDQLGGRAYHRVTGPSVDFSVATAGVRWTADGTAFDLSRASDQAGADVARAIGVEHDIRVDGPGLQATLDEGDVAIVHLGGLPGSGATDVSIDRVGAADMADPWLLQNARRDIALGYDPGIFSILTADAEPTATASPTKTVVASTPPPSPAQPTAAAEPDPSPTKAAATATPKPTPKPTAAPTPKPTPKPTPGLKALSLSATACPGGFSFLAWSKAPADGFDHYQTIRSTSASIPAVYPPTAPAVAPAGLYGTDRTWTSAIDAGLDVGDTVHYRTIAFTAGDDANAASSVKTVPVKPVKAIGALAAEVGGDGSVAFDWTAFGGAEACFSWYKLVVSATDTTPSYLDGDAHVWAAETQAANHAEIDPLTPGTYHFRLQALRSSESGTLLVAETDPVTVVVP